MKKGILLIAAGHKNYGKMAAALAATIKAAAFDMPICIAYTDSCYDSLTDGEKQLFSHKKRIPDRYYQTKKGNEFIKCKMFMYELSPFDETLFLDSDMIWLKRSPGEIFESLKDHNITFSNHGITNYSIWGNIEEIRKAYAIPDAPMYGLHSEFVYFKKLPEVRAFFTEAISIYNQPKIAATDFAGGIPDELPFMIAGAKLSMHPHIPHYQPIFWIATQQRTKHSYEVAKTHYGISMGGNVNTQFDIQTYNNNTTAAYQKLGLQNAYRWKMKKDFLPERTKI